MNREGEYSSPLAPQTASDHLDPPRIRFMEEMVSRVMDPKAKREITASPDNRFAGLGLEPPAFHTKAESVAALVFQAAKEGTLERGTELNVSEITKAVGVSRNTVIEGIGILYGAGIVQSDHGANRQLRVRDLTPYLDSPDSDQAH